jgi:hypothetical protein
MRSGKVLGMAMVVVSVATSLEAATGARAVRAAVRLEAALQARVADPAKRTRLGDEAGSLVTALRAVRHAERDARCFTYTVALARARGIDAALPADMTGRARARVLHAAAVLERVLGRQSRVACP